MQAGERWLASQLDKIRIVLLISPLQPLECLPLVVEASGLRKGEEYVVQSSHTREDGSRALPDVILHLPDAQRRSHTHRQTGRKLSMVVRSGIDGKIVGLALLDQRLHFAS
jgi:hypothetical protein